MAKKLRWRFVLVSMLSLATVLAVIMLTINVTNYAEVKNSADVLLEALAEGGGQFRFAEPRDFGEGENPEPPTEGTEPPAGRDNPDWHPIDIEHGERFSAETPYETRFFTVVRLEDGTYVANVECIAAVDADTAVSLAEKALASGKNKGYQGVYRYLVVNEGNMVLFVDCFRALKTAENFLETSLIVSAAALLGMFILVFLFSKRAVKPIAEAYERQKQFVTEASHELKTPITIISANNELMQLEYGDNESTDAIEHQVKRLSSMVKSLVSLSRLDEVEHIEKGPCNLSDCLSEHVDLYRNALTAGGRTLTVDADEGVTLVGNLDLLAQLTSILLDNAIKYAHSFTEVSLKRDKGIVLMVRNDAEGLSDGDKSRCFERFYRDVDVTQNVEGSGIGLAIAKQIVTLHHGTATASAKDGVFTVKVTL